MEPPRPNRLTGPLSRRQFIAVSAIGAPALLAACTSSGSEARTSTPKRTSTTTGSTAVTASGGPIPLAETPSCDDGPTKAETEGPFYTPSTPEKTDFRADVDHGTGLVVSGAVVSTACVPIANALLDVWQANADGEYDNEGYTLRGHLFTDADGRFSFTTVVPGLYPGRTRHIHVKVKAPKGPLLTTQLYFPGEPRNASDSIYDPALEMALGGSDNEKTGAFNFVVRPVR